MADSIILTFQQDRPILKIMPFSTALIRKLEIVEPRLREVLLAILEEVERNREESVTKKEFSAFAEKTENSFQRVWKAIEELAQAQKRTEERVEELAQAQKKTEETLVRFERHFDMKLGALGARWGLNSEASFREALMHILKDTGFTVEHYLGYDHQGSIFGRPDQVELDLIIKDAEVIVAEMKSSTDKGDVSLFERKVRFYQAETGRKVSEKMIISPFIDPRGTWEMARQFGIRLVTSPEEI